jgi:hypothetical protein
MSNKERFFDDPDIDFNAADEHWHECKYRHFTWIQEQFNQMMVLLLELNIDLNDLNARANTDLNARVKIDLKARTKH